MNIFFDSAVEFLIQFIGQIGYLGIFIGMFLESTIIPIPSELIMIPAGIAVSHNNMNFYLVMIVGVFGNVAGAAFSYYLAASIGRALLLKIGKYFLINPETIIKIENFFKAHGPISVFIGRLLPGFRHFISIPAGIAKMNIRSFYFYTTAGSSIWAAVLLGLGFFIGENQQLIKENLNQIILGCFAFCAITILAYFFYKKYTQTGSKYRL